MARLLVCLAPAENAAVPWQMAHPIIRYVHFANACIVSTSVFTSCVVVSCPFSSHVFLFSCCRPFFLAPLPYYARPVFCFHFHPAYRLGLILSGLRPNASSVSCPLIGEPHCCARSTFAVRCSLSVSHTRFLFTCRWLAGSSSREREKEHRGGEPGRKALQQQCTAFCFVLPGNLGSLLPDFPPCCLCFLPFLHLTPPVIASDPLQCSRLSDRPFYLPHPLASPVAWAENKMTIDLDC